jgi:hypothetical protein
MHLEAQLLTQRREQDYISASQVAEGERTSNAQAPQGFEIGRELLDEAGGGDLTERGVEGDEEANIDPQLFESAQSLSGGLDERRGSVGSHDLTGVAIEGDGHGKGL